MPWQAWLLLAAIVAIYLIDLVANFLNLRTLRRSLPEEFKGVYDESNYHRLQGYTAASTQFEVIESTFNLIVLVVFWLAGGFNYLDQLVRGAGLGPIVTGLLYFGAIWIARFIISRPFDLYDTFVLEEKFGFNKTTPAVFIADQFKGILVTALTAGPLAAIVLALLEYTGDRAWIYGWAATSFIMLLLMYLAPVVIMPLFNKFTPLEESELREAILDYAREADFRIEGVFVMDGSKRSSKSNAFFTGFGRHRKIVLFDTLIEKHTVPELVAVLAHEVAHFKKKHIQQRLIAGILAVGLFFFLASSLIRSPTLFAMFRVEGMSVYCGLLLFIVVFKPFSLLISLVQSAWSRANEYAADRFAVETTGSPGPLADALIKLSRDNLANLAPHPLYVVLYHSHPPMLQRLDAIRSRGM